MSASNAGWGYEREAASPGRPERSPLRRPVDHVGVGVHAGPTDVAPSRRGSSRRRRDLSFVPRSVPREAGGLGLDCPLLDQVEAASAILPRVTLSSYSRLQLLP